MNGITQFDKRLTTIPSHLVSKIAQIDELKGHWSAGVNLSPQFLNSLKRSVLVTSTGASTRIEGSNLSDNEVDNLMKGISIEKFTNRDEQEVRGYFELLQQIFDSWPQLVLSESTIKHLHQELLKYVDKDSQHRGKYKNKENQVKMFDEKGNNLGTIFNTTPAYLTNKEMNELVDWTKDSINKKAYHPLLIVGNFIVEFLSIHPFEDGNGRLSRILTNLLMLKEGYLYMPYISHEKLVEDNKQGYYLALRSSQKTFKSNKEDITPWLDFFFDILLSQSKMATKLLSEDNIEMLLSRKQLAVWQYIMEVEEATPMHISQKVNIARPTVNQVLNKLLKLNKIERIGEGSSIRYRKIIT